MGNSLSFCVAVTFLLKAEFRKEDIKIRINDCQTLSGTKIHSSIF